MFKQQAKTSYRDKSLNAHSTGSVALMKLLHHEHQKKLPIFICSKVAGPRISSIYSGIESLEVSGTLFYRLETFPVTQPTVSKH